MKVSISKNALISGRSCPYNATASTSVDMTRPDQHQKQLRSGKERKAVEDPHTQR
jgi:hypothetical protein